MLNISSSAIPGKFPVGFLQTWGEAGAQLESALSAYLDSCLDLERRSATTLSTDAQSIVSELDHRLASFHTFLARRLAEARSSIARTRNRLVSKVYCLPPEISARIFSFAILVVDFEDAWPMESAIVDIYRTLHHVVGVCSVWRKIGLTHGGFWSLIPSLSQDQSCRYLTKESTRLCLDRAGSELHLAAQIEHYMDPTIEEALSVHGARFRTINIQVSDLSAMQEAFVLLADNSVPGSLTELSAWLDCYEGKDPPFPSAEDFIFHEDTLRRASFGRIMNSLRVLRLKSVNIHMTNISFEYLAELRLQELALGHEAVLHGFLRALASASQLRDLEIISVIAWTNHIDDDDEDQDANQPDFLVFLPNLRRLFIEGLYGNVIRTVLHSIAPGPFSLVISLTDMCRYIKTEHETWICGENPLKSAVKDHIVDTVMLGNLFPMLEDVTPVLSAIPTATTLYIDDQYLSGVSLLRMTRTRGTNSGRSALPKFRAIHISRSIIDSLDHPNAFQDMIASYPLQELTLGGAFGDEDEEDEEFDFDGSDERVVELMDWFDARIPDFTVVGRHHFNVWFQTDVWQLW